MPSLINEEPRLHYTVTVLVTIKLNYPIPHKAGIKNGEVLRWNREYWQTCQKWIIIIPTIPGVANLVFRLSSLGSEDECFMHSSRANAILYTPYVFVLRFGALRSSVYHEATAHFSLSFGVACGKTRVTHL